MRCRNITEYCCTKVANLDHANALSQGSKIRLGSIYWVPIANFASSGTALLFSDVVFEDSTIFKPDEKIVGFKVFIKLSVNGNDRETRRMTLACMYNMTLGMKEI